MVDMNTIVKLVFDDAGAGAFLEAPQVVFCGSQTSEVIVTKPRYFVCPVSIADCPAC